jgi:hypothetical protein
VILPDVLPEIPEPPSQTLVTTPIIPRR